MLKTFFRADTVRGGVSLLSLSFGMLEEAALTESLRGTIKTSTAWTAVRGDPTASPLPSHTPHVHTRTRTCTRRASTRGKIASCPDGLQEKEGVPCLPRALLCVRHLCSLLRGEAEARTPWRQRPGNPTKRAAAHRSAQRVASGGSTGLGTVHQPVAAPPTHPGRRHPFQGPPRLGSTSSDFGKASVLIHVARAPSMPTSRP